MKIWKLTAAWAATAITLVLLAAISALTVPAAHSTARIQNAEVVTVTAFWGLKALLAFAAKCALVGAAVVTVAYLSWDRIAEWLKNRFQVNQPNRIALSMLEKVESGEYQVCAVGIDQSTGQVIAEGAIRSGEIAPELRALYNKRVLSHSA